MSASLVGSEMCIRDSPLSDHESFFIGRHGLPGVADSLVPPEEKENISLLCLLYTSDAADDM
eukprot:13162430-Alexandrium_andersonii.AAC.1